MRSNFILSVESTTEKSSVGLFCTLGQANKAFNTMAFALCGNKKGYQKLTLSLDLGENKTRVLNVARFNGLSK